MGTAFQSSKILSPSFLRTISENQIGWTKTGLELQKQFTGLARSISESLSAVKFAFPAITEVFAELSEQERKAAILSDSGWLPHKLIPFSQLEGLDSTTTEIDQFLTDFFLQNWSEISANFSERVEAYEVDAEAKRTFAEALRVHEIGAFRSVPRLLFPEFERLGADEVNAGQHERFASLKELRAEFEDLPAGAIFRFENGYPLWKKFESHVYAQCLTEQQIDSAKVDAVPNRHACLHGIVVYNSAKSSFNAIVMADLFFHLVDRLRFFGVDADSVEETSNLLT